MSARVIGWFGVASFVLVVVGTAFEPLWDAPGTNASSREIDAYVGANRDGFLGSIFTYTLAMSLFFVFAVGLWAWLRERPGVDAALATLYGAGAVSLTTLLLAGFVPVFVMAYRAPGVEPARELYDLSFGVLAISGAPTAIALGAYAAIVIAARPLPLWTAWFAIVGAVAHVVLLASFLITDGFFSLEGGVIVAIPGTLFFWYLATGVAMIARPVTRP